MPETADRIDEVTIPLKKTHLILACVASILMPAASAVTSYMRTQVDIQKEISASRLESEQRYVRQDSVNRMIEKLDILNERLSRIEGYLEERSRKK